MCGLISAIIIDGGSIQASVETVTGYFSESIRLQQLVAVSNMLIIGDEACYRPSSN